MTLIYWIKNFFSLAFLKYQITWFTISPHTLLESGLEVEGRLAGGNKGSLLASMMHTQPTTRFHPRYTLRAPYLPIPTAETLVQASISAHLDPYSSFCPMYYSPKPHVLLHTAAQCKQSM